MTIHDDADMATVVKETVINIDEGARHMGKADRHITQDQIDLVRSAIAGLEKILSFKEGVNSQRN